MSASPDARDERGVRGRMCASAAIVAMALSLLAAHAGAQGMDVAGCGTLANAYGPFDYTNPTDVRDKLPIVEQFHFDRGVDALKGHAQSGPQNLGGDLAYTLRAFPNHHRALDAMGRYQIQAKQAPAPGARLTAECYFERAMAFAPKDAVVHMLYGIYLVRKGNRNGALDRYLEALEMMPESTELHYNLGLLYADMERYDDALEQAHIAYGAGFPLLGLRNKLVRAGAWRDPPPAAPASAPPESADGASAEPQPATETPKPDDAASAAPQPATEEP